MVEEVVVVEEVVAVEGVVEGVVEEVVEEVQHEKEKSFKEEEDMIQLVIKNIICIQWNVPIISM